MTPRTAAIAAFASVALAGVLVGAALDRYVLFLWSRPNDRGSARFGPPGAGGPEGRFGGPPGGGMRGGGRGGPGGGRGRGDFGPGPDFLARQLELSDAQRASIDSVMGRQAEKLRMARERIRPEMDSVFAETTRQIEARLTPEQRTKYRELRMRGPGGGPGERGRPPR
jgi:Spy/CpxP family protein refolding chaperone